MPFPNEHAARLEDPGKYVRFRRENDKFGPGVDAIWGIKSDGKVELQAIRFDAKRYTETEARAWLKDHDYSPKVFEPATGEKEMGKHGEEEEHPKPAMMSLETRDLDDVQIFAVGKWNGRDFSEKDLDEMVGTFRKTKSALKPYVKLGHGDGQEILRNSELPAAGWIENLRRVGSKLVADLKRVPAKIAEIVSAGGYRTRSVELYRNFKHDGEIHPWALKALALLGGETPAVDNLDDIIALYAKEFEPALTFEAGTEAESFTFGLDNKEEPDMTLEEIQKKNSELEKKFSEAQAEIVSLKAKLQAAETHDVEKMRKDFAESQEKVAKLEKDLEVEKASKAEAEQKLKDSQDELARINMARKKEKVEATVQEFINKKKLAPAQKEIVTNLLLGEAKFKLGDKEYDFESAITSLIESGSGVTLPTDSRTEPGEATRGASGSNEVGVELDLEAQKYAREHKVSYKTALLEVSRQASRK